MKERDAERTILHRYFILSGIFGAIIGVRYTLDVWVFEHFALQPHDKFLLITLTFVGMLVGEILGGRLSDRISRCVAIDTASIALASWALTVHLSVIFVNPAWFHIAAISFGTGLGLFHASLDAWVDEALTITTGKGATDRRLVQGYLMYNAGYLIGAFLAFPALLDFQWTAELPQGPDAISHLKLTPYAGAFMLSMLILLFRPASGEERRPIAHSSTQSLSLRTLISDYLRVLQFGRQLLIGVVLIGACVALLIQYIDHLAPARFVLGRTVSEKTINIFLFNATVCFCLAALATYLHRMQPANKLHPVLRAAILSGGLSIVGAILIFVAYATKDFCTKDQTGWMLGALMLGFAQAVLLMLPPLIKAWVLDFAVQGLRATALSVLGISKRLFAIVSTVSLYAFTWVGKLQQGGGIGLYWILISLVGLSLVLTILLGIVTVSHTNKNQDR